MADRPPHPGSICTASRVRLLKWSEEQHGRGAAWASVDVGVGIGQIEGLRSSSVWRDVVCAARLQSHGAGQVRGGGARPDQRGGPLQRAQATPMEAALPQPGRVGLEEVPVGANSGRLIGAC